MNMKAIMMDLGRFCVSGIFILSAVVKIIDYENTVEVMASKGVTFIPFFLYTAVAIELMGGIALLLGCGTRLVAALLLLFLIPVTYIMHDFWVFEGADRQVQMILFTKNIAIFGGLLYIFSCGTGKCSIDYWLRRR